MSLTAFLHGYPPGWSMGGEMSTHRTLRTVPGSVVFTETEHPYTLEGVSVKKMSGTTVKDMVEDAKSVGAQVLLAHSSLSLNTVHTAKHMRLPVILSVHAPPRFAPDLRRAWRLTRVRVYNTNVARRDWGDPRGWVLHPPVGKPEEPGHLEGPHDAITLTSSLLNKGVNETLEMASQMKDRRFIIVRSPAHVTHGSQDFDEKAAQLPNVEVWDRLHPNNMHMLWRETKTLLVPSRYETYGLSALEAAWHNIPSVHVDTPHVREGIGLAAYLLPVGTIRFRLREAVESVESNYDTWSRVARSRVEELSEREAGELAAFAQGVAGL